MKKIYKDKIINIENTQVFDNKFLFEYLDWKDSTKVEIIFMSDLLKKYKNDKILKKIRQKPAIWSNVYSPEDEFKIFENLFNNAIKNKKKIHIVGITLKEEVKILEEYYEKLGFLREDINCFDVDFSVPLITTSVNIENIIWKGSDYKKMKEKIFFNPPVREGGQVKAMFKGINRGVIAGICINDFNSEARDFLGNCVRNENILAITLGRVLKYNLEEIGLNGKIKQFCVDYQ